MYLTLCLNRALPNGFAQMLDIFCEHGHAQNIKDYMAISKISRSKMIV